MVFKHKKDEKIIHSLYFAGRMNHEYYMQRCLVLAKRGMGKVSPNPMVGAVIVKDDKIIGEGYHQNFGGPHAEVHAIDVVSNKRDLREATIYVSLEPCAHHGKTPPCANLIVEHGIPKVVVAQRDPNPKVAGGGIAILKEAGIEVVEGVLENEARHLNRRFLTFQEKKRPYIILKWAQSADGIMDLPRGENSATGVNWISHPNTKKLVHQWRADEDAIAVGANTIRNDNPSLTVREVFGKNPFRIVISRDGVLPLGSTVLGDEEPTIVFNTKKNKSDGACEWIKLEAEHFLQQIMSKLFDLDIASVFIEGGKHTLESFIQANLWDEARIIQSQKELGNGLAAPILPPGKTESSHFGNDTILTQFNR